jgi:hypothetical protein
MRKLAVGMFFVLIISAQGSITFAAHPSVVINQSCSKMQIGKTKTVAKKTYVCVKNGKSGIWKLNAGGKALTTTTSSTIPNCLQSGPCVVGSKGPGGGIVFYDAGSVQPWGRFLEVAPAVWMLGQKSISKPWGCKGIDVVTKTEIGSGKTNTELIVSACSEADTAARIVSDLTVNGFDDWFLPAKDELSTLISSQKLIGVYSDYNYWTSSQASVELSAKFLPQYAWSCRTAYGQCGQNLKTILGWGGLGVIPIRAFS